LGRFQVLWEKTTLILKSLFDEFRVKPSLTLLMFTNPPKPVTLPVTFKSKPLNLTTKSKDFISKTSGSIDHNLGYLRDIQGKQPTKLIIFS
jgi:hypothetical protein